MVRTSRYISAVAAEVCPEHLVRISFLKILNRTASEASHYPNAVRGMLIEKL